MLWKNRSISSTFSSAESKFFIKSLRSADRFSKLAIISPRSFVLLEVLLVARRLLVDDCWDEIC